MTTDPSELEIPAESNGHSHDHFVQFYDGDAFLIGSVARFIAPGLKRGDAVIIVATPEHRAALEEAIRRTGTDVQRAIDEGRYEVRDAAEALAGFMVDGHPDPILFVETVGELVATTAAKGHRLRIFGEMVALLWAAGDLAAAVELEELWNDLAQTYPFTLFCAYPSEGFVNDPSSESFRDVCAAHDKVLPAESYIAESSPDERLRQIAMLQQRVLSEEARTRMHEAASGREQALAVHDTIVQGLTVAKMALEQGHVDQGLRAVSDTLDTAKDIVTSLLGDIEEQNGGVEPGDLRRPR